MKGYKWKDLPGNFLKKVEWEGECLIWKASRKRGYGQYQKGFAHRFSYELFIGKIPEDMNLLHTCDNPLCVNPDHLLPGTQKQNMEDCVRKGRIANGVKQHLSKLTDEKIVEIRDLSRKRITQKEIAKLYGVKQAAISDILTGKTWKHVG